MENISISFSLPVSSTPKNIWQYYTDVSLRKLWESDLEEFHLFGDLQSGVKGIFKLQDSPEMEVILSTVINEQEFTEQFNIPDMGMVYFSHQIETISKNRSIIKALIWLVPSEKKDDQACYGFLKQVSDDIIDKAFKLKELVER